MIIFIVVSVSGCIGSNNFNNQYISFKYPLNYSIGESSTDDFVQIKNKESGSINLEILIVNVSPEYPSDINVWQEWEVSANSIEGISSNSGITYIDGIETSYIFDDLGYHYYLVKNNLVYILDFDNTMNKNEIEGIISSMKIK